MTCKIYDIQYKVPNDTLPREIIVDLSRYYSDIGFGNLNSKAYQVVKDITSHEAQSCKVAMISRYPGNN